MDKITWEVSNGGSKEKIPYVPMQRSGEKANNSEKEGVRIWNLMRKTLLENDLMESREDKD